MTQGKTERKHRLNAGICLVNRDGKIFTALRKGFDPKSDAWQMPQGGIDDGENPLVAAKRELFEETGIPDSDLQFLQEYPDWLTYDFPPEVADKLNSLGQKQKWFCFRYLGDGNIDLTRAQDHEFDAYEWRLAEDILEHVVDFKSGVYRSVLLRFRAHFVMS